jgi:8-oxo-dGTP pyrophosphatase MutT (NUDIX family)
MSEFTRVWKANTEIESTDQETPVRQVYVWLLTEDNKMVIVSKDGDKWQLPGGKPDAGESLTETGAREVAEETGIDISAYQDQMKCFGYYIINEPAASPADYLQVRMLLKLPVHSDTLNLHADNERGQQPQEDMIRFVGAVGVREIAEYIPWMPEVDEYQFLVSNNVIEL